MYFTLVFMNRTITALLFAVTCSVNAQQTITKTYTIEPHTNLEGADLSGEDLSNLNLSF